MNKANNDCVNDDIYGLRDCTINSNKKKISTGLNNYSKKILIKCCSFLVGVIGMLSPGIKNVANAKDKNFTKTSEIQYSQKTEVIDEDDQNTLEYIPKSFLVRKSEKGRRQELDLKNNERILKRRIQDQVFNQIVSELETIEKVEKVEKEKIKQIRKFLIKKILVKQNQERLKKLEILQTQNVKTTIEYLKIFFEPNKSHFDKKFLNSPILPMVNKTKQIEKQLKKELVKEEIFKRNFIHFQNRQGKRYTFNKLILLMLPILERLYPIFCVNNKDKKKMKLINAVQKRNINKKNYVGIIKFLELLERRRYIDKLVQNYETIMLFSMFLSAYQLKFNSSGFLVKSSEPFMSTETLIEEWITKNRILICLILFSTVTILTMNILTHLENKKEDYFLYLLKILEILQKRFIFPKMSESFKDRAKEILLYIVINFLFNFMISILVLYPVDLHFELNFDQDDINLNITFEKKDEIN